MFEAISLFASLDSDDIASIEAHTNVKRCRKNTVIIERGDESNALYFICTGKVRIYLAGEDGKEITLNELGPGDYFGELALVGEIRRTASAITLTECELRTLSKVEFKHCLEQHPRIAFNLIHHLSLEVRRLSDELADMALLDVYGRVVKILTDASKKKNGQLITPKLTQQAIADRVGCSREMVNRILKELKVGGYLSIAEKHFVINRKLPARW
ncbi:MAG: Crp/Fnr family transcriptional regulator [Thiohalocapsa sp. PB-PSB1]|jgi:CRP/FNR family cyclic AMP-dependent transcriptional regulator|nr:MAG: Crp/Fnr family transcriptional regulator [Thiohalocapsa sp. PB-PSB1]HCS90282.1 Crp/Fnr family transcriptional regulator [Chromatiaceae bacterium]